jgi:preprotein translocase subunit SecF
MREPLDRFRQIRQTLLTTGLLAVAILVAGRGLFHEIGYARSAGLVAVLLATCAVASALFFRYLYPYYERDAFLPGE